MNAWVMNSLVIWQVVGLDETVRSMGPSVLLLLLLLALVYGGMGLSDGGC